MNKRKSIKNFIKIQNEKGITLVALVITIVILLILSGVATAELKNGGIITHGKAAVKKQEEANEYEQVNLASHEAFIDGSGIIEKEQLSERLREKFNNGFEIEGPFSELKDGPESDIRDPEENNEMHNISILGKIVASKQVAELKIGLRIDHGIKPTDAGQIYYKVTILDSGNKYKAYKNGKVQVLNGEDDSSEIEEAIPTAPGVLQNLG